MKLLALKHTDVKADITDNYNAALKYMVEHGAPFNLHYKTVTTRIKDLGTYLAGVTDFDVVFLNYQPTTENRHDCITYPHSKEIIGGRIPCGVAEDTDKGNWLTLAIAHELIHALAFRLEVKFGIKTKVNEIMDTYYKNNDWNAPDGNFAMAWQELKPFMKLLFPLYNPIQKTDNLAQWGLTPVLQKKAVQFLTEAKKQGFNLKITHGYRDPVYQNKLYAQGRTVPGKIVTNATGKSSKHCQGKAFDIAFVGKDPYPKNADWKTIGKIGKSLGLQWGGDWRSIKDVLHFEI